MDAGDWAYYINREDEKIYKIQIDGSNHSHINDDGTQYLNVAGDWIY
ncbi:DUF5050 domain-containing protein [Candidatus Contubernalis alkalaceticus]